MSSEGTMYLQRQTVQVILRQTEQVRLGDIPNQTKHC